MAPPLGKSPRCCAIDLRSPRQVTARYPSKLCALSLNRGQTGEASDDRDARCSDAVCRAPTSAWYAASGTRTDTGALRGVPRTARIGVHHVGTRPPLGHGTGTGPTSDVGAKAEHGETVCRLVQYD